MLKSFHVMNFVVFFEKVIFSYRLKYYFELFSLQKDPTLIKDIKFNTQFVENFPFQSLPHLRES